VSRPQVPAQSARRVKENRQLPLALNPGLQDVKPATEKKHGLAVRACPNGCRTGPGGMTPGEDQVLLVSGL
jgi:hypothetical protein